MPLWVAAIIGGFVQAAGTLVGRVLVSLGIGYASFSGLDVALDFLRDQVVSNVQGMPALAVQVASTAKVGVVLSILFSALAARMFLQGVVGGVLTRFTVR